MGKTVNVLIIRRLGDAHVEALRNVDPRLEVYYAPDRAASAALAPRAEVLLANWRMGIEPGQARELRWVQFGAAGLDNFFRCRKCGQYLVYHGSETVAKRPCEGGTAHEPAQVLPGPHVTLTTASGVAAIPMSEYVVATMLAFARQLPSLLRAQQAHRWIAQDDMVSAGELHGSTLGVVGLGDIGGRTAEIAKALGMRVLGLRRSTRETVIGPDAAPADELYPANELERLLSASDFVVLSVPLTLETEGLIGERQLRAMKPSGVLVNVARGGVVDEIALRHALQEGWLAGAIVDVTAQEPLPPDNPLWDTPNVILTSHIAGVTSRYNDRLVALFCENLRRYLDGRPLLNVLDRAQGY